MKKVFLFAAVAALALVGCNQQQSELEFDEAKLAENSAVVKGKVQYTQQAKNADGTISESVRGVAGATVVLGVNNADYSDGAAGKTYYEVKTAEDGSFEFKNIPAGEKAINAELDVIDLMMDVALGVAVDKSEVLTTTAAWELAAPVTFKIHKGSVELQYLTLTEKAGTREEVEISDATTWKFPISGKVTKQTESAEYKESAGAHSVVWSGKYVKADDTKVAITVYYDKGGANEEKFEYPQIDVTNGEYSTSLTFKKVWDISKITVEAKVYPYLTSRFSHNYAQVVDISAAVLGYTWSSQSLTGVYKSSTNVTKTLDESFLIEGVECVLPETQLKFEPNDKSVIRGIGNPDVDLYEGKEQYKIDIDSYDDQAGKSAERAIGTSNPLGFTYL